MGSGDAAANSMPRLSISPLENVSLDTELRLVLQLQQCLLPSVDIWV